MVSVKRTDLQQGFSLGHWQVLPELDVLRGKNEDHRIEPMVMDVLVVLAAHQGSVVSKDLLIEQVWNGRATTDDVITAKISALRKALGDDRHNPTFLETVQKRGYRLIAPVTAGPTPGDPPARRSDTHRLWPSVATLAVAIAAIIAWYGWPWTHEIHSIAVLQFRNLSDDRDRFQYIADGFSEELVVSLGRVPDIQFTRTGNVDNGGSLRELAGRLDVDAVITGSLRTDGDKLRVTAQLVRASGFQLWADSFDGRAQDVFDIQERVASVVRNKITGAEESLPAVSRPATFDAYNAYMLGLYFLARRDLVSLQRASDLFAETTSLDPGFGPAYLRHAVSLLLLARYRAGSEEAIYSQALDIAARGAEADAGIRDAIQLVNGFVNHQRGNWTEADNAYSRSLQAATVDPTAYHWYSLYLGDIGLTDRALSQALAAYRLEPASPSLTSRVAIAYLWHDDMENARHFFDIANSMAVGVPDHYLAYAVFLMRQDRLEEARDAAIKAIRLAERPDAWISPLFDSLSQPEEPIRRGIALRIVDAVAADESVPAYIPLALWAALDQPERMMDYALEQASGPRPIKNLELIYQQEFREFRQQSRFPQLLDQLGLTRHWSSIGCHWSDDHVSCDAA